MNTVVSRPLVNSVRLHVEERGEGAPILCIHGCGSTALVWDDAAETLAGLGRVISYDRRGCGRSERPQPYPRTSAAEHAEDAAALLRELGAAPAVVVGRSMGGTMATELALRHPDLVRAFVVLESDAPRELAPAAAEWVDGLRDRLGAIAERSGIDAVGEALITEVADADAWRSFPAEIRETISGNGPAILAEIRGEWWLQADESEIAGIEQPALVVAASTSPPSFRESAKLMTRLLPNARLATVSGGHLIDPAGPDVVAFIEEVLG